MIRGKNKWSKTVTQWYPRDGRTRGRHQKKWEDDIRQTVGITWGRVAIGKPEWRKLEEAFVTLANGHTKMEQKIIALHTGLSDEGWERTVIYSDDLGVGLGFMLRSCVGHWLLNICVSEYSGHEKELELFMDSANIDILCIGSGTVSCSLAFQREADRS
ncbi:hypothetical protein EVAR_73078_1 [Eumeta japonica]|uniref:Uncharacterized protein n=1 Tax=Eumeta variegata TaxID=151549 RepID=A0A4C1SRN9_EUMVA|nr:hypothetical protein EVAR_73078_1 [Eumeta japonica]